MMTTLTLWTGVLITLCIFSFLYRDNPLYRFAEHLFIGVSAGYYFSVVSFHRVLRPNLLAKLVPSWFATGREATAAPDTILLIPMCLGLLMLFRLSRQYSWVSRFAVAFVMGVSTGLTIVYATQQLLIPQVRKAIVPLFVSTGEFWPSVWASFSNWVLVVGTLCCLFYFFFSTEHRGPVLGTAARTGIAFLMISFGAAFGATVMSRVSLLIGRFQFLLGDWLGLLR